MVSSAIGRERDDLKAESKDATRQNNSKPFQCDHQRTNMKLVAEFSQQQGYVFWRTIDPSGGMGRVVIRHQQHYNSQIKSIGIGMDGVCVNYIDHKGTILKCMQPTKYQYMPAGVGENRHPNTGNWNDPWLILGEEYYSAEIRAVRDIGGYQRRGEVVRYYFTAPVNDAREYAWIQTLGKYHFSW